MSQKYMNKKIFILSIAVILMATAGVLILNNIEHGKAGQKVNEKPVEYVCHADGKICWDGSVVGRTGADCHFTACPVENATSTMIRTTLGQPMTGLNVTLTPKEIISDSRCPAGVQCIWAGTVEVKTAMTTPTGHGEHVVKLNERFVFGDFYVTLVEVTPEKKAGEEIPGSSYRFAFEVKKR
jgi:hypothetical protein